MYNYIVKDAPIEPDRKCPLCGGFLRLKEIEPGPPGARIFGCESYSDNHRFRDVSVNE